jgi:hypothetical protein
MGALRAPITPQRGFRFRKIVFAFYGYKVLKLNLFFIIAILQKINYLYLSIFYHPPLAPLGGYGGAQRPHRAPPP